MRRPLTIPSLTLFSIAVVGVGCKPPRHVVTPASANAPIVISLPKGPKKSVYTVVENKEKDSRAQIIQVGELSDAVTTVTLPPMRYGNIFHVEIYSAANVDLTLDGLTEKYGPIISTRFIAGQDVKGGSGQQHVTAPAPATTTALEQAQADLEVAKKEVDEHESLKASRDADLAIKTDDLAKAKKVAADAATQATTAADEAETVRTAAEIARKDAEDQTEKAKAPDATEEIKKAALVAKGLAEALANRAEKLRVKAADLEKVSVEADRALPVARANLVLAKADQEAALAGLTAAKANLEKAKVAHAKALLAARTASVTAAEESKIAAAAADGYARPTIPLGSPSDGIPCTYSEQEYVVRRPYSTATASLGMVIVPQLDLIAPTANFTMYPMTLFNLSEEEAFVLDSVKVEVGVVGQPVGGDVPEINGTTAVTVGTGFDFWGNTGGFSTGVMLYREDTHPDKHLQGELYVGASINLLSLIEQLTAKK